MTAFQARQIQDIQRDRAAKRAAFAAQGIIDEMVTMSWGHYSEVTTEFHGAGRINAGETVVDAAKRKFQGGKLRKVESFEIEGRPCVRYQVLA